MMNDVKKILIVFPLLSCMVVSGEAARQELPFNAAKTFAAASCTEKAPVVDGKISPGEYAGGYEQFGILGVGSDLLTSRQAKFFAALDGKYLYLACQSELPDPGSGVELRKDSKERDGGIPGDDNVEFLIFPPGAAALYHFIINPADVPYDVRYPLVKGKINPAVKQDWNPDFTAKSGLDEKFWTIEVKIPLKDFDVKPGEAQAKWLFQFARSWTSPSRQGAVNKAFSFADPEQMNPVVFSGKSPAVRFTGMGDYVKGKYDISFTMDNPGTESVKIRCNVSVQSQTSSGKIGNTVSIPAGSSKAVSLKYSETQRGTGKMSILFTEADSGRILLQRCLAWQYPPKARWVKKKKLTTTVFKDAVKRFNGSEHFRIVALGASNTERYMPCMHWLDVLEVGLRKRFGRKFQIINSGVSGNNTRDALARFERDVAFFKPDLVIVTLGGNDCDPRPEKHVPDAEYRANLEEIAKRIGKLNAIPVFQTYYKMDSEAMDPEFAAGFVRNMESVRDLAKKHNWNLVDHYAVFDLLDPNVLRYKLMINPMHTNEEGNLLMGVELLRHFGVDPAEIVHPEKLLPAVRLRNSLDL